MNNKQWSFFDNSPFKILYFVRFDKRLSVKRKALGQSGIESVIKGGLLRSLFHFIGVMFGL